MRSYEKIQNNSVAMIVYAYQPLYFFFLVYRFDASTFVIFYNNNNMKRIDSIFSIDSKMNSQLLLIWPKAFPIWILIHKIIQMIVWWSLGEKNETIPSKI